MSKTKPIVTQESIRALENQRARMHAEAHYTIEGTIETAVNARVDAENEVAITSGKSALKHASQTVANDFTAAKPGVKSEYIRAQMKVASNAPERSHKRGYGR